MQTALALSFLVLFPGLLSAADFPEAEISNSQLRVKIFLPDQSHGYYHATRFDWSGVIYSLRFKGHEYYGPWFQKTDPKVHDFVYQGPDIVAGPCTAITGPVDEFAPLGWDQATPGSNFIKIGVGALVKTAEGKYDMFTLYKVADSGKWTIAKTPDSVTFTQEIADKSSGYGYSYQKIVRLADDKPEMILEHSLKNSGTRAIGTRVYNHNFLVLDGRPPGPGFVITVPFRIQTPRPPNKELAEIRGNQIVYLKTLQGRDIVTTPLVGFGDTPADNDIRIENGKIGAGMRITSDRPLASESLWSIRAVLAMEPFVSITIEPGNEFRWRSTYSYYILSAGAK
jgi:hypothetical protein